MGNTDSSLEQLEVERDKGEVYEDWTMAPGVLGGVPVTVFSAAHPHTSRKRPYVERALQASRVYRHPGLLKYLDGGTVGGEVVVVTEQVTPLQHHDLAALSPLQVSAGLLSAIETLVFLHERAGVSHNNVSAASVFVTSSGAWKLWGLEYSCSFGELTRDHIEHINDFCYEKAIPPDDKARISPAYQHARDSYAFACFVETMLQPNIVAEIAGADDFISWLRRSCKSGDWSERPRLSALAEHRIFHHDFLKLHHNLANVLLLTEDNRELFIKSLGDSLSQYPEELVAKTLAGTLLSRPILLHPAATTHLMPKLLTPRTGSGSGEIGLFSARVFSVEVVPHVVRLFSVHDAAVRSTLLAHLPHYVSLVPTDVLKDHILPELLLGIRDSNDGMVVATLQALAHLVPILGANTVIGQNRHHLFTTAKPKAASTEAKIKMSQKLGYTDIVKPPKTTAAPIAIPTDSPRVLPPPPPPRTASLPAPRTASLPLPAATAASDGDVLPPDDASVDSLGLNIPERSSPDGGEDCSALMAAAIRLGASKAEASENDEWSDWEEMQDASQQEAMFPGLPTSPLIHDSTWPAENDVSETEDTLKPTTNPYPVTKDARQGTGMKLTSTKGANKDEPKDATKSKEPKNLGEEYDILALKVKKKHDVEMDLFADMTPTFSTQKYDLETMLIEADCKVRGFTKDASPSVSEALAEMDMTGADVGDAWGQEDDWPDQIDALPEPPVPSAEDKHTQEVLADKVNGPLSKKQEAAEDGWDDGWGSDF